MSGNNRRELGWFEKILRGGSSVRLGDVSERAGPRVRCGRKTEGQPAGGNDRGVWSRRLSEVAKLMTKPRLVEPVSGVVLPGVNMLTHSG